MAGDGQARQQILYRAYVRVIGTIGDDDDLEITVSLLSDRGKAAAEIGETFVGRHDDRYQRGGHAPALAAASTAASVVKPPPSSSRKLRSTTSIVATKSSRSASLRTYGVLPGASDGE